MALYDCFTFFNELDILELRLKELADHVDYFVVTEATKTFTGKPKPLHFAENRERFARWEKQIIHVVVDDMPDEGNAWTRERFQRDATIRGIAQAADDDIIMISDVDEIAYPWELKRVTREATHDQIIFLECVYYTYKLNLMVVNKYIALCAVRATQKKNIVGMQALRSTRVLQSKRYPSWLNDIITTLRNRYRTGKYLRNVRVREAGWHFTSVNTPEQIQYKIRSYAHQEHNTEELNSLAAIHRMIAEGRSICGRAITLVGDDVMPKTVRDDPERWGHLIHRGPPPGAQAPDV
ncbi:MAG: N-acetylglucosaminyltransferase [Pseudomonadota bacterium]